MPTRYTEIIEKDASFQEFALRCARVFIVSFEDEPIDAEIPKKFSPNKYWREKVMKSAIHKLFLQGLSAKDVEKNAKLDYKTAKKRYNSLKNYNIELKFKYEAMLRQVEEWVPPTASLQKLKDFMIDQIKCSEGDYNYSHPVPQKLTGEEWLKKEFDKVEKRLTFYRREATKEVRRCKIETEFMEKLRESI